MSSPTWRPSWWRRAERRRAGARQAASIIVAADGLTVLGSGTASDDGIASKAAMLDRAAHVGLPVPSGVIVCNHADVEALAATAAGDAVRSLGAARLAVRSAFAAEDGDSSSQAGWFLTELDVTPDDLPASVERVRASGERHTGDFRRDVVVMEMVHAVRAGVAFSEPGTYDDVVNVVDGLADRLVGGEAEGERVFLPRLERAEAAWQERLRVLLADVRDEFGDRPWDVEWADDGARCWLVQIRPITQPTVRDELLTLANHAEILPELPSTLMTSVIEQAGPDLFAWYRRRVPGLPADRDFLHVVAGRPMINLSLLEDMMRHLGLPTALVADSIGGDGGTERPAAPLRSLRRSPSLLRLGLAQVAAVLFARRNERRIASIGVDGAQSFGEALDQLHHGYVTLVTGMFPLSSAIGPPLAVLRRFGTLHAHASSHRTITTELADRLTTVRSAAPADRAAAQRAFIADFGHRGVYESDIARPRFADDPSGLALDETPIVDQVSAGSRGAGRWAPLGALTWPIWWLAAQPLAARERFRHEAMRSFASIRSSLVALARRAVAAGQLTSIDDLWLLDAAEVRSLDRGRCFDEAFVAAARGERARLAELHPPHVVHRFDDPSTWADDADDGVSSSWHGLPLTVGSVEGTAWVLNEPSDRLPDGFDPATTILVARSVDAGWVGTLRLIAGAVVQIGGDLSHGSILIRELRIPAVTNVRGVMSRLATGDAIRLDAGHGSVTRLVGNSV